MKYVGPTLAGLLMGAVGVLMITDFKGTFARYDESVALWWASGRLRQSLRPQFTAATGRSHRRLAGVVAIGIALLLLLGEIPFI